jgi:uncharacterized membrane protein
MTESPAAIAGLSRNRIEALADGIFAVAMTLLVLDIKMLAGINLLLISAAYFARLEYLRRHAHLAAPELAARVGVIRRRIAVFAAMPLVSIATAFYSPRLALYLYLRLPLVQIAPSRLDSLVPYATRRRT